MNAVLSEPVRRGIVRMLFLLLVTGSLALAGCGSDEPAKPTAAASAPGQKLDDPSPEAQAQRRRFIEEAFVWPADEDADAHDAWADNQACQKELQAHLALAYADDLVRVVWLTRCMESKGWTLNPNADPSVWK
jgi:hypothetical protein